MWACCIAAVALLAVMAQQTSAQSILGYQISSNVKEYLAISDDICAIVEWMTTTPYNFKAATEMYEKGKASSKKLKDIAKTPRDGEPFFEKYKKFFGSPTWSDAYISDALAGKGRFAAITEDGRAEAVKKGIESALMFFYMTHELDAALVTLRTKSNADNQNEGAGHNVDEAFAIWVGNSPGCTLYGVAERRANEFGTRGGCNSPGDINLKMVEQFQKLKGAARAGDLPLFEAAYQEVQRLQYTMLTQSSLKYAIVVTQLLSEGKSADSLKGDQVEGATFYRAIAPLVAEASAPASTALEAAWNIDMAPTPKLQAEVTGAFNQTYAAWKVDPAKDIGNYVKQFDCPANTLPATSASLDSSKASSSSTAKSVAAERLSGVAALLVAAFVAVWAL